MEVLVLWIASNVIMWVSALVALLIMMVYNKDIANVASARKKYPLQTRVLSLIASIIMGGFFLFFFTSMFTFLIALVSLVIHSMAMNFFTEDIDRVNYKTKTNFGGAYASWLIVGLILMNIL